MLTRYSSQRVTAYRLFHTLMTCYLKNSDGFTAAVMLEYFE